MTSKDSRYCGAHGTHTVASSAHNSDGPSDFSGPLLLTPTITMDYMTSEDRCYYGAHSPCMVATSAHNSDGPTDISGPLLLPTTIATSYMTSEVCYYYRGTWHGHSWY
jgi:hypothetical protein